MATESPNSFRDPYWADLAAKAEARHNLTPGLLVSVLTNGERSNKDQVSEKGASTVFQIIPKTRDQFLKRDGVDAYLNDENAADVAARTLKDGLNWAKSRAKDPLEADSLAAGYYHAGGDPANWGPKTKQYVNRVMVGQQKQKADALGSGFAEFMAKNPAVPAGRSTDAVAPPSAPGAPAAEGGPTPPANDSLAAGFGEWLAQQPTAAAPAAPALGLIDSAIDSVTGNARRTPETDALPDWASMPELNSLSLASAKTGLGTMLSNPRETAQIIQANFPGAQVRQDEKGNYLIRSAANGQEYAIKPGFSVSDIPRALGALTAFTPAGGAKTILGSAIGAGATQGAIEATQAATGGEFNPGDVALATVAGGVVPAAARAGGAVIDAGKGALSRLRGLPEPAVNPAAAAQEAAVAGPQAAPTVAPQAAPAAVAPVAEAAPAAAMPAAELTQTAKKAAEGGFGSGRATTVLAEQAAPNPKTLEAAKRLGIEEHLQPDHVSTSQAYRELAQAVKSIPGSEARAAEVKGLDAVAKRAEDLIEEIGGTTDVSTLNSSVKQRMQTTQAQLEKQADALYAQVREQIPLNAEAPANNVLAFVRQRADELGGAENLTPMEKRILARLSPKSSSKTETVPVDPETVGLMGARPPAKQVVTTVKQPTYALLDDVRRDLGAASRMAGPFKDADTGLAKKLYSLATDDQAAVVGSHGATELFDAARASVAVRKGLEDDLVALFGKNLDASFVGPLSGSIRVLAQGDTSKLLRLLSAVPEAQRPEIVASGLASAFRTASTRGPITFSTYAKWYEGLLKNKQAHAAIMTNLPPSARKQLSDLYRVSKGISDASRERITTGRINAVMDEFKGADNLASRLYDVAKRGAVSATAGTAAGAVLGPGVGGAVAAALTKGAKKPAIQAADALLSSPEFIQLAKAGGNPAEKARRLAKSKAFDRYVRAVGSPREMTNRERWILQVMQGRLNTQD